MFFSGFEKIANAYSKTFDEYIQLGKPINDLFNKPFSDYFFTCYEEPSVFDLGGLLSYGGRCGEYFMGIQYEKLIKELKKITGHKRITVEIYSDLVKKSRNGTLKTYLASLDYNNTNKETTIDLHRKNNVDTVEITSNQKGDFDGLWFGIDKCYEKTQGRDNKFTLSINNDMAVLRNQSAVDLGIFHTNFKALTMKGKIFKKNKVGLNSEYGYLGGKFKSKNQLLMKYDDLASCLFEMTKVETSLTVITKRSEPAQQLSRGLN